MRMVEPEILAQRLCLVPKRIDHQVNRAAGNPFPAQDVATGEFVVVRKQVSLRQIEMAYPWSITVFNCWDIMMQSTSS